MGREQVALFPMEPAPPDGSGLLDAAEATIGALRDQAALQPWHELDAAIVLELARAVGESRGIAKSQMFGALLAARARLPEPVPVETDAELIEYEATRELAWITAHPADDQNQATA